MLKKAISLLSKVERKQGHISLIEGYFSGTSLVYAAEVFGFSSLQTKINFKPWMDEGLGTFHPKLWKIKSNLALLPEPGMSCSHKSWQRRGCLLVWRVRK